MIPRYDGAQAVEATYTANEPLPAGGYVCRIMGAEVKYNDWGDQLIISYDVAEGEHMGHFADNYRNQSDAYGEKKWKGNFRLNIPNKDKNKYFESTQRTFNNFLFALEDSNHGYNFDWDEKSLKNKLIGLLVREKEWEMMGRTGWTTEACTAVSTAKIRSGDFAVPKAKPLPQKDSGDYYSKGRGLPGVDYQVGRGSAAQGAPIPMESDDDLPF